jgi:hypothetical protein
MAASGLYGVACNVENAWYYTSTLTYTLKICAIPLRIFIGLSRTPYVASAASDSRRAVILQSNDHTSLVIASGPEIRVGQRA